MESLLDFICAHANQAHWIIFGLIMLAGLNVPISEDVMLIVGGAIAGTYLDEGVLRMFLWIFAACWISAWEAYWIGRLLGPKLYDVKWFNRILTQKKVDRLHHYYEKFGVLTFIIGRFIPGGVRNALFMSAGLGKMPFLTFIFRDGIGALLSATVIFSLGYWFGEHHQKVIHFFQTYNVIIIYVILIAMTFFALFSWFQRRKTPIG